MNSKVMMVLAGIMLFGAIVAGYLGYKASAQPEVVKVTDPVPTNGAGKSQANRQPNQAGLYGVVIAAKDLMPNQKITSDDVYVEYLKQVPPGSFNTKESVIGKRPYISVAAGSLLTEATLVEGGKIPQLIKSGERAIGISVDEVIGSGGHIRPGDSVDVLLFTKDQTSTRDNQVDNSAAQIIVSGVRVVSYGQRVAKTESDLAPKPDSEEAKQVEANNQDNTVARSAVLAIPHDQISKLVLASNIGSLRLAVRSAFETPVTNELDPFLATQSSSHLLDAEKSRQLVTASSLLPGANKQRASTPAQAKTTARRAAPAVKKSTSASTKSTSNEPAIVIQRGSSVQSVNL